LARAVRSSLDASGPGTIGWIRSCGTGQRDLDAAEAFGLRTAFEGTPPPVTSTEPYFSHVNGVSPLLGLAAVLVAQNSGRAPAQPEPGCRPGLKLQMLQPGKLPPGDCLLTATAFGGTNGALVVRAASAPSAPTPEPASSIVIAGLGAVSALGATANDLLDGLSRPAAPGPRLVQDEVLQRKLPGIALHRRERLARMAMLAVAEALSSAGLPARSPGRFGVLVGLAHGQVSAYGRFFEHILTKRFDISAGRLLLQMSRFSLASEIAQAFGLPFYSGAMAPGVHGGVQLLAHGAEILRASPDLDGLMVVAADEWTELMQSLYGALGLLGDGAAYDPAASGCVGGEGAAAILLCRRDEPATTDWARIEGTGFAGDISARPDPAATAYRRAINHALAQTKSIDFVIGQGCGWPAHDGREQTALAGLDAPLSSVLPHTGMTESAGGLFGAIAAAASVKRGKRRGLLVGSTERGANSALVLGRAA
jgi:3-oxoacyl-(acyl-carrier-protein) synthase